MDYKTDGQIYKQDNMQIIHDDCMEIMKQTPDNYYDLAVCDPPYGIGADKANNSNKGNFGFNKYKDTDWDNATPSKEYFDELFRVSKNQIIWGGNYFIEFLPPKMCWIVWDKKQDNFSFSDGELAWTSFNTKLKFFRWSRSATVAKEGDRIHPTQKSKALYSFCLHHYAKEGQKILDTHLGSGSNAISAHYAKMEFVGCELDEDYYKAAIERIRKETRQLELF